jgi:LEA14-like dessication related protein
MEKKAGVLFLAVVFAAITFASCQSLGSVIQEPQVSLKSVELMGVHFNGVDLLCHVDVKNNNRFDIPFPEINWELFVAQSPFISGLLKADSSIKKGQVTTIDIPITVSYEGLYKTFLSLWNSKEIAYAVNLDLGFSFPVIGKKNYHLDFAGNIPLMEMPKVSPGEIKIAKLDFSGIELACGFNVENPNNFPIPFPDIAYEYEVAGVPLLTSSLSETKSVAAKSKSTQEIKLSLRYADIFKAAASLANKGEAPSVFSLSPSFPIPAMAEIKDVIEINKTLPVLQRPEVSLKGINIKSLGLRKLDFTVNWEVENKNSFAMDISDFNYDFKVNDKEWAQGKIENSPRLKPNTKALIPLTVSISALDMVKELVNVISSGNSVNYSCIGAMGFLSDFPGLDKLDLPLNLAGKTRLSN